MCVCATRVESVHLSSCCQPIPSVPSNAYISPILIWYGQVFLIELLPVCTADMCLSGPAAVVYLCVQQGKSRCSQPGQFHVRISPIFTDVDTDKFSDPVPSCVRSTLVCLDPTQSTCVCNKCEVSHSTSCCGHQPILPSPRTHITRLTDVDTDRFSDRVSTCVRSIRVCLDPTQSTCVRNKCEVSHWSSGSPPIPSPRTHITRLTDADTERFSDRVSSCVLSTLVCLDPTQSTCVGNKCEASHWSSGNSVPSYA